MSKPTPAALIAGALLALSPACADAGPCTEEIKKFEDAVSGRLATNPSAGPNALQSVGAQRHAQPTPGSVAEAQQQAETTFAALLEGAKELDAQGNPRCMRVLNDAKLRFNMR
jgi:hypothetical protein